MTAAMYTYSMSSPSPCSQVNTRLQDSPAPEDREMCHLSPMTAFFGNGPSAIVVGQSPGR